MRAQLIPLDGGRPIDRHYIERFLETHRRDIRGRVLEVRDPAYTRRFGGDAVSIADVLDIDGRNGLANVVADLQDERGVGRYRRFAAEDDIEQREADQRDEDGDTQQCKKDCKSTTSHGISIVFRLWRRC